MKYKIGDKVRVRTDLVVDDCYGGYSFTEGMEKYAGQIVTIDALLDDKYLIDEDLCFWCWTEEMFEPVEYKPTITIPIDILKRWDLLLGQDGSNTKAAVRNDIQYLLKELERGADDRWWIWIFAIR